MNIVLAFLSYAARTIGWDAAWQRDCSSMTVTDHHGRTWHVAVRETSK